MEAESDELFQNAKKKVKSASLHIGRLVGEPTSGEAEARSLTTIRPCWAFEWAGSFAGRTNTQAKTLVGNMHRFTYPDYHVFTDEYESYQRIERQHSMVAHGYKEWARDDNVNDVFEVHTNSAEPI